MPPSTGHLAPDTQFPFLDLTGAKGRGMGWPGQHPWWETAGWKGLWMWEAGQPRGWELPRLSAEMLQDCARLARHGSGAACESQLCTTRPSFPPLPTGLSIRCIIIIPLSFLFYFFFSSLAVSPLTKISSAQGRELCKAKVGAEGSLPVPAPASPHGHCGEASGM